MTTESSTYFEKAKVGVSEQWLEILECEKFRECFDKVENKDICPKPENILNVFRITPFDDLRVVIMGQDPYPSLENAQGLAFSTPYELQKVPASLKNMYKALINSNYLAESPSHGCLEGWAKQGVLLLNMALTCDVGKSNSHPFWKDFTVELIKKLCVQKQQLIFLLWGGNAQKLESSIKSVSSEHIILKWRHPSPMANRKDEPQHFKYCDHFKKVNDILEERLDFPIIWDPDYDPEARNIIFTDGHCKRNGQPGAMAGWGIYAPAKFMGIPNNLKFRKHGPVDGDQTNNRAELQAIYEALKILVKHNLEMEPTMLITDSEYTKNVITNWMWRPGWIKEHKNEDIIGNIKKILESMKHPELVHAKHQLFYFGGEPPRLWPGVSVLWRRAAHDIDFPDNKFEQELFLGNEEADRLSRLETSK